MISGRRFDSCCGHVDRLGRIETMKEKKQRNHTKYGFCKWSKKWVPRDEMLGINAKVFDEDNQEERVTLRLSPEAHADIAHMLRENAWDNELKTEEDLRSIGLL